VDVEALVRDILARYLTAEGFCCYTACDAISAMHILREQAIDLVTTGINMPGVSGLGLLGQFETPIRILRS